MIGLINPGDPAGAAWPEVLKVLEAAGLAGAGSGALLIMLLRTSAKPCMKHT